MLYLVFLLRRHGKFKIENRIGNKKNLPAQVTFLAQKLLLISFLEMISLEKLHFYVNSVEV